VVDEGEFAEYARARWLTLVKTGISLGCTLHDAEDLAQTTLLKVDVAGSRVRRAEHRDAYVSKVLLNTHREVFRRRRWRERITSDVPDVPVLDSTEATASALALRDAMARLSHHHRQVVALRFFWELSVPQIADVLNVPLGTVKSRLSRALAELQSDESIAGHADDPERRTRLRDQGPLQRRSNRSDQTNLHAQDQDRRQE
jgi:RNA polymerase sigma-70 factor (sigma-E family)